VVRRLCEGAHEGGGHQPQEVRGLLADREEGFPKETEGGQEEGCPEDSAKKK
jgi:hypothetical protein